MDIDLTLNILTTLDSIEKEDVYLVRLQNSQFMLLRGTLPENADEGITQYTDIKCYYPFKLLVPVWEQLYVSSGHIVFESVHFVVEKFLNTLEAALYDVQSVSKLKKTDEGMILDLIYWVRPLWIF